MRKLITRAQYQTTPMISSRSLGQRSRSWPDQLTYHGRSKHFGSVTSSLMMFDKWNISKSVNRELIEMQCYLQNHMDTLLRRCAACARVCSTAPPLHSAYNVRNYNDLSVRLCSVSVLIDSWLLCSDTSVKNVCAKTPRTSIVRSLTNSALTLACTIRSYTHTHTHTHTLSNTYHSERWYFDSAVVTATYGLT